MQYHSTLRVYLQTAFALSLLTTTFETARSDDFPTPFDTEKKLDKRLTSEQALQRIQLPEGFQATLCAAEPEVQNPIAMAWDGRGRLWVAECYTYGEAAFDLSLRDRILVFEDTDGDGRFDIRKVFTDELQQITSIEVGYGGVWVTAAPRLLFIPDEDGNDIPDAAPITHLEGFHVPPDSYHNLVNGLRFGPDGWLYGRCGATGTAEVGIPGTPLDEMIPVRGGMWRYHPKRRVFEAITSGNTNPWGHDWDKHGELFYVNTVNGHFWHVTPGAHFVRAHTLDPNPRAYSLIDMHADHWHFDTTLGWQDTARRKDKNLSDSLGGGHVHIGAMFYQADNWPVEYRDEFFTLNQHGRRANQEHVERHGSGYIARHRPDFFTTGDDWFLGIDLRYGPDGSVYIMDWSDTGECHERDGVHRTSGRIYKIAFGNPKSLRVDLTQLPPDELVALHTHSNEWYSRQARVELASRSNTGDAREQLRSLMGRAKTAELQLRALWTLNAIHGASETLLRNLLTHESEHLRAWGLRLLSDDWPLDTLMSVRPTRFGEVKGVTSTITPDSLLPELARMAREDRSSLVRLTLASILQRLPVARREGIAELLVAHAEDADDHNLPLMIWYGLIPIADADPEGLVRIVRNCKLPMTRLCIARRLAEDIERNPAPLNALLDIATKASAEFQKDILTGMAAALTGWRQAKKPTGWDKFAADLAGQTTTADVMRDLSALFGDGRAIDEVKKIVFDKNAEMEQRKSALRTLIDNRPPDLERICEKLIDERYLNVVAASGLAQFDDVKVAELLVKAYRKFHHTERNQLLEVLTSRAVFAKALLGAVRKNTIPRQAITAFHARQMRNLNDDSVSKLLAEVWGEARESAVDKKALMEKLTAELTPDVLIKADKANGRLVFNKTCANCHRLHGYGGQVGPDLTGAGRTNLHYNLENIVDPGAQVAADFRLNLILTEDGRVISGIILATSERTLKIQTMTEQLTIDRDEIVELKVQSVSMMPEGLLAPLTSEQTRDLIAYLMHPSQVPLSSEAIQ